MIAPIILYQPNCNFPSLSDGIFKFKSRLMCLPHLRANRPTGLLCIFKGTTWIKFLLMVICCCRNKPVTLNEELLEDKVAILSAARTVFGKAFIWQNLKFDRADICLRHPQAQGVHILVRDHSCNQKRAIFL